MDDLELVKQLRARSADATEFFMERYRSLLQHCISQFESDQMAREDLFQELTWYIYERLDRNTFDPDKGSFGTWLYRVAWCRCVDLKRKAGARSSLRTNPEPEPLEDQIDLCPDPSQRLADEEVAALVRHALAQLPEEEKNLICLRYVEGMTLVETGRKLSISLEQTKYRLRRALASLRSSLQQKLSHVETFE
jgi:RNA polymerase sigma-70 factor (ECF subfamily)